MTRRIASVRINLLASEAGGRSTALCSGYRSLLRFEGNSSDFGFELLLDSQEGVNQISPGGEGFGRISLWAIDYVPLLYAGQRFEVREGLTVVGHGVILDPLNSGS